MAHIDCISRLFTLTLPKENDIELEPDFVNPPHVSVLDIDTNLNVLAINSQTSGTSSKITFRNEKNKFDFDEEQLNNI